MFDQSTTCKKLLCIILATIDESIASESMRVMFTGNTVSYIIIDYNNKRLSSCIIILWHKFIHNVIWTKGDDEDNLIYTCVRQCTGYSIKECYHCTV